MIKNYLEGCAIYKNQKSQSFSFLDLTVSELYSKNQLGGGANLPPPTSKIGLIKEHDYFSTRMYTRECAGDALLRTMLVKSIHTIATLIDVNFHVITKAWFPLVLRIGDFYDIPTSGILTTSWKTSSQKCQTVGDFYHVIGRIGIISTLKVLSQTSQTSAIFTISVNLAVLRIAIVVRIPVSGNRKNPRFSLFLGQVGTRLKNTCRLQILTNIPDVSKKIPTFDLM